MIADDLHEWTLGALSTCTESQRSIYMRVHGITDLGATNPETAADIARELQITRQTAHDSLNAARLTVYRSIALRLITREQAREAEQEMPVPGVSTLDKNEARATMVRYTLRVDERIQLGAGSEAMIAVEKHGDSQATNTKRIAAHQAHARKA